MVSRPGTRKRSSRLRFFVPLCFRFAPCVVEAFGKRAPCAWDVVARDVESGPGCLPSRVSFVFVDRMASCVVLCDRRASTFRHASVLDEDEKERTSRNDRLRSRTEPCAFHGASKEPCTFHQARPWMRDSRVLRLLHSSSSSCLCG